jgi:hypothetical protein
MGRWTQLNGCPVGQEKKTFTNDNGNEYTKCQYIPTGGKKTTTKKKSTTTKKKSTTTKKRVTKKKSTSRK